MNELTKKERKLAADLLHLAAEVFSNHGCNDLPDDIYQGWNKKDHEALLKAFHKWNNTKNTEEEDYEEINEDWCAMHAIAEKLHPS